jgi:hypothetical protein
MAVKY